MAPQLDLTNDELLTTTRAVRKRLDFDRPVGMDVVRECLEVALQAPSGSNAQGWHFVLITDDDKKQKIAGYYAKAFDAYRSMNVSAHALAEAQTQEEDKHQMERVVDSAEYLAANMAKASMLIIPCIEGRIEAMAEGGALNMAAGFYGSILPAFWSFMLAARARGIGTAWTTLHLTYEKEVADLLGIDNSKISQCALSPIAYTKGTDFKAARRKPLDDVLHVDRW